MCLFASMQLDGGRAKDEESDMCFAIGTRTRQKGTARHIVRPREAVAQQWTRHAAACLQGGKQTRTNARATSAQNTAGKKEYV